jgi:hypothetical protein
MTVSTAPSLLSARMLINLLPCTGRWLAGFGFGCLVVACGGQNPSAATPAATEPALAPATAADEAATPDAPTPAAKPQACNDATCAPCGETLCPNGFYCDETLGACSWVPECAGALSCECLEKRVGACSCEARGNGIYVSCSN